MSVKKSLKVEELIATLEDICDECSGGDRDYSIDEISVDSQRVYVSFSTGKYKSYYVIIEYYINENFKNSYNKYVINKCHYLGHVPEDDTNIVNRAFDEIERWCDEESSETTDSE